MRFNKISLAAMLVGGTMLLAACGGDPAPAPALVQNNLTIPINKAELPRSQAAVRSISGKSFAFPSGVEVLGTKGADTKVTLTVSNDLLAPYATVEVGGEGGYKAAGSMGYGSCIFKMTSFTPPTQAVRDSLGSTLSATLDKLFSNGDLALNKPLEVPACSVTLNTAGKPNGSPQITGTFQLGSSLASVTTSNSQAVSGVSIDAAGNVFVGTTKVGTVAFVTGTGP